MQRSGLAIALAGVFVVACAVPATSDQVAPTGNQQGASASTAAQGAPGPRPLDVAVKLDNSSAASQEIGSEGGTMRVTASDGTRLTLDIPKDALTENKRITMTPVTGIDPLPFSNGLIGAVQLEPDGLELAFPAVLTIEPTGPLSVDEVEGFSYFGTGKDFHMYPLDREHLRMKLFHFSGSGTARGTPADRAAQMKRTPASSQARLMQKVAAALHSDRLKEALRTKSTFEAYVDVFAPIVEEIYRRALVTCDLTELVLVIEASFGTEETILTESQRRVLNETKCISLTIDSSIDDKKTSAPDWQHVGRADLNVAGMRVDPKSPRGPYRDLVGTGDLVVTFYAKGFPCKDATQETVPLTIRIVGGLTSASPTLILSFDWPDIGDRGDALDMFVQCDTGVGGDRRMLPGTGPAMWRAMLFEIHGDEVIVSKDDFGEALRITGLDMEGNGQERVWRKTYERTRQGHTFLGDGVTRIERTTIELRRTPAK